MKKLDKKTLQYLFHAWLIKGEKRWKKNFADQHDYVVECSCQEIFQSPSFGGMDSIKDTLNFESLARNSLFKSTPDVASLEEHTRCLELS